MLGQGASGWRLDVAPDIDPGPTVDSSNHFWEEFSPRHKARGTDGTYYWRRMGDASSLLLGQEMDGIMNYRFRSAVLAWMFDRCLGEGCRGDSFVDNDSNDFSSSGPISKISLNQFVNRLRSLEEDYPRQALLSSMNLLGSHDTNRIRFLLRKVSGEDDTLARRKQMFLASFQTVYLGAVTIYYGDEVGLTGEGLKRRYVAG